MAAPRVARAVGDLPGPLARPLRSPPKNVMRRVDISAATCHTLYMTESTDHTTTFTVTGDKIRCWTGFGAITFEAA